MDNISSNVLLYKSMMASKVEEVDQLARHNLSEEEYDKFFELMYDDMKLYLNVNG